MGNDLLARWVVSVFGVCVIAQNHSPARVTLQLAPKGGRPIGDLPPKNGASFNVRLEIQ